MAIDENTIFQTTFKYQMHGQTLLNVLHWRTTENTETDDEVVACNLIASKMASEAAVAGTPLNGIKLCVSQDVLIEEVQAQVVYPDRYAFVSAPIGEIGSRPINTLQNIQTCVTKRTKLAGRKFRGAIHLPPGGFEDYAEGFLTGAFYDVVTDNTAWLYTDYPVPLAGLNLRPVVFHGGAAPIRTDVFQRYVQTQGRVMVRRTVGRGI